jgi:hypothetical protein
LSTACSPALKKAGGDARKPKGTLFRMRRERIGGIPRMR